MCESRAGTHGAGASKLARARLICAQKLAARLIPGQFSEAPSPLSSIAVTRRVKVRAGNTHCRRWRLDDAPRRGLAVTPRRDGGFVVPVPQDPSARIRIEGEPCISVVRRTWVVWLPCVADRTQAAAVATMLELEARWFRVDGSNLVAERHRRSILGPRSGASGPDKGAVGGVDA